MFGGELLQPYTTVVSEDDGDIPLVVSIVLNWNRKDDTLASLTSLFEQATAGFSLEVLLVDNGSTDGSVEAVEKRLPSVGVIRLPDNLGYSAGMNIGLRAALDRGADWTFLVNNDAIAEPCSLERLVASTSRPGIGIAAPTVYYAGESNRVWPSAGRRRRLSLAPIDTTAEARSGGAYDVDWANACCILVRRELWEQVGLFDEHYRFYYEDHDLCIRAKNAGWRIVHVPDARVRHHVSASTGEGSPAKMYLLGRSSVVFYARHSHGWHRVFIVVYRLGSLLRTLATSLVGGNPGSGWAYLKGVVHGFGDVARRSPAEGARTHP